MLHFQIQNRSWSPSHYPVVTAGYGPGSRSSHSQSFSVKIWSLNFQPIRNHLGRYL